MRSITVQRLARSAPVLEDRRSSTRTFLDVDWFLKSSGCSTFGRGLELSPRGAHLPVPRTGNFAADVTLFVSLPERTLLVKAKGRAVPRPGPTGWLIRFDEISEADRQLLLACLASATRRDVG